MSTKTTEQKVLYKIPNRSVFLHSSHKGKEYYGVALPWRVVKELVGKTLNVTLVLPDGKTLSVWGVEVTHTKGRPAIMVPVKNSDRLKGVKKVDVVVNAVADDE
ncbi:hypothetical protein GWK48_02905 [Metallosphaera tengchongensis]|uniref:DUF1905 domain-containing protein n=1 Tax=Metallosphaera tengchongensis TaxID=1532350 RepID=A0A6N0NRZ3_9CREN|nr:hypothetical protein [Metallosphaera tengchongensis]QKQ99481.1 hypothetical protein GWK48_02905 [Metallosphaera tengchongensis]